ncbi:hypothetical protein ACROYT_G021218 [Oculina patagonica]
MADQQRRSSPPPTYEEAIADGRPPPPYSENQNPESTHTPQTEFRAPTQRQIRVSPIITNPDNVIVNQPGRRNDRLATRAGHEDSVSQPRKKRFGCNCLCSAFQWTPCSCDCEIFCFNCLGFLSYLLLCAPGVYLCWGCKRICPETCGECYARRTSLMDSYDDREDSLATRVCWFCVGPCCCFTCDADTEEKFAAYYKATGKWKPPEQCAALLKDPAIEKFGWIRENTDMFFKFKPRSVRNAVIFCLLIPGALVYFFKKQPAKDVM